MEFLHNQKYIFKKTYTAREISILKGTEFIAIRNINPNTITCRFTLPSGTVDIDFTEKQLFHYAGSENDRISLNDIWECSAEFFPSKDDNLSIKAGTLVEIVSYDPFEDYVGITLIAVASGVSRIFLRIKASTLREYFTLTVKKDLTI